MRTYSFFLSVKAVTRRSTISSADRGAYTRGPTINDFSPVALSKTWRPSFSPNEVPCATTSADSYLRRATRRDSGSRRLRLDAGAARSEEEGGGARDHALVAGPRVGHEDVLGFGERDGRSFLERERGPERREDDRGPVVDDPSCQFLDDELFGWVQVPAARSVRRRDADDDDAARSSRPRRTVAKVWQATPTVHAPYDATATPPRRRREVSAPLGLPKGFANTASAHDASVVEKAGGRDDNGCGRYNAGGWV